MLRMFAKKSRADALRGHIESFRAGLVLHSDPGSLQSFGTPLDVEAYRLTLNQGPEATAADFGKMNENVTTAIGRRDKAETFGLVKPLDNT